MSRTRTAGRHGRPLGAWLTPPLVLNDVELDHGLQIVEEVFRL